MSANGRLTAAELATVEDNDQLAPRAARAYIAWKAAAARAGKSIYIVEPAGAYRSYEVQADMRAHPERYNLNPNSKVKIAAPGYSTHGFGDRVDIGGDLLWALSTCARYGFYREFGANDPNHFRHNGTVLPAELDVAPIGGHNPADPEPPKPTGALKMEYFVRPQKGTDPARTFGICPDTGEIVSIQARREVFPGVTVRDATDDDLNAACRIAGIPDGIWPEMMAAIRAGELETLRWTRATGLRRVRDGRVVVTSGVAAPPAQQAAPQIDYAALGAEVARHLTIPPASDVPTAAEIAQAVRAEIIAPDQ